MKSRRIPSLLTAAAVCCVAAESGSVRGGGGGGGGDNRRNNAETRPQRHEQQQDEQQQQEARRSLQQDENSPYWWHNNQSEEKDIVYHPIGTYSSNVNEDKLLAMHAENNVEQRPENALDDGEVAFAPQNNGMVMNSDGGEDGEDGDDGGRSSFSVYSIAVSNDPDTSQLPHRQPTKTPTPKPTRFPTLAPIVTPSPIVMVEHSDNMNSSSSNSNGMMYYHPLWSIDAKGCASSLDPPSSTYRYDNDGLFDTKLECCQKWFQDLGDACVSSGDLLVEMNDHASSGSTTTGNSNDNSVTNDPPSPPTPAVPVPTPPPTPEVTLDSTPETPSPTPFEIKTPWSTWNTDEPTESPFQITPYPTTPFPTSPAPITSLSFMIGNDGMDGYGMTSTAMVYSESFEAGSIHLSNKEDDHFAWSASGNAQWQVTGVYPGESYDGGTHVATIGGSGKLAMEGALILTVGGGDDGDDATANLRAMAQNGGYITFGIQASVAFPMDALVFRLNGEILGYWTKPTDGWERVTAYLPPSDGYNEDELKWTYSYYGSVEQNLDVVGREGVVQLDALVIEATTGDLTISDDDLELMANDNDIVPALNLHHPSSEGSWEVLQDNNALDGSYVLSASTRSVIRAIGANSNGIATYHGAATMSFTIITGPFGGALHFAIFSNVHTPIDVLEVRIDGDAIMAATGAKDHWEKHSLDLTPGRHVVTFTHISNPSRLPMSKVEDTGQPGSSKVDGLRYVNHIDPSLLTPVPTTDPTLEPTLKPTPYSIPPQNYCGVGLATIRESCHTVDAPQTCNDDDDGPCPSGTFCWGNVECDIPIEALTAWVDDTSEPTVSPTPDPIPPQNYCSKSLASIKAECASRTLLTCNDDDEPCPEGTFCWGKIKFKCDVPEDTTPAPTTPPMPLSPQNYCGTSLASIKAECASGTVPTCNDGDACAVDTYCWGNVECDVVETDAPTVSPTDKTIESFLNSFFSGNTGGSNSAAGTQKEDQGEEVVEVEDTASPQEEDDCPEGTSPVPGLLGCCAPDPSFLGDGACDAKAPYNTQECGYDLGDCCQESCNPDTSFACAAKDGDAYGPFGYYCLDPRYSAIDEDACGAENREWIGDGGCDSEYNTQACGWDGGDCCRESCDVEFAYYECGREAQPFDCKNPDIIYRAGYVP